MGSGQTLLDQFSRLYVINLPQRTDRRRQFARQLRRLGLSYGDAGVMLYPAIRPDDRAGFSTLGTRGCFMSHLGVLTAAAADQADSVIVCEDDLDFAQDFAERLPKLLAEVASQPWDILYLGHYSLEDVPPDPAGAALIRLAPNVPVGGTHFMVVRRSVHADLIAYLQAILTRPPGHPDGGPMHVDQAFSWFRARHPQVVTLAALPPLGYQRRSRTDIHVLPFYDRLPVLRTLSTLARRLIPKGRRYRV
jgi:GR25 family glycosyltransferase involved in LPS biosynthesis